ncbi:MAG: glycosyltransferase family 39 protein [Candidatus Rokubacteria bacterium]|nr:glycosyltransferase family 39 protein [Candidatus Rokubacteria bacterium]
MSKHVLLGVALVAAALFLGGLGSAPFVDPPEGFHAAIARDMLRSGEWITPHVNGVRYFDKPALLYWLMAGVFSALGLSEGAARLPSALPAIGVAVVTAWLGMRLGSTRLGLVAGLVVAANLELFLFARLVKPDLLFVFLIMVVFAAFIEVYARGGRAALLVCYASLGLTILAKDVLGAIGPVAVIGLFLLLVRDHHVRGRFVPWAGVALFLAVAVPWYVLVEWANRGFLWYTVVDNPLLNFARRRVFPDEDVPLSALEFLGVTAAGFFPWSLALPWALWRGLRDPKDDVRARPWLLLALWTVVVLGFFALSPFKLPHYGLPAFPAMALLVAKLWEDVLDGAPGAPAPRILLLPGAVLLLALAAASALAWQGWLALPGGAPLTVDLAARNMAARGGQEMPFISLERLRPVFGSLALIFGLGGVGALGGLALRRPMVGLGALLAAMIAFLPVTVEGFALFARSRSVRIMTEAIALRAGPSDVLAHEGALENSASWLLALGRPVKIVNGLQSTLAFGATFPEAWELFWDASRLAQAWRGGQRVFLLSAVSPERSAVRELPPAEVHRLVEAGGRWLYSNRP